MTDILIDSSVWIDFFNYYQSKEADALQFLVENNDNNNIYICSTIFMEVLRGIKDDNTFYDVKETLLNFSILDNDLMEVTNNAINIYRDLRKKGITIRKQNDCIIASYAILNNIQIFHKDSDFELMANNTKLKIYKY
ncbi:MAG: PIN domain-containing protein [Spirochaetaceae bacterium]|jgi:predicted nucleic acid-binding protein|nr:PIN domain-containing protein [Spirochaetaceae bacterium]